MFLEIVPFFRIKLYMHVEKNQKIKQNIPFWLILNLTIVQLKPRWIFFTRCYQYVINMLSLLYRSILSSVYELVTFWSKCSRSYFQKIFNRCFIGTTTNTTFMLMSVADNAKPYNYKCNNLRKKIFILSFCLSIFIFRFLCSIFVMNNFIF